MKKILFILTLCVFSLNAHADPALIIPAPKDMKLFEKVLFEKALIILADKTPRLKIAADEINQRVDKELQGESFSVQIAKKTFPVNRNIIIIGTQGTALMQFFEKKYPVTVPSESQGYGISFYKNGNKSIAVLSGHDSVGTLYAAVTFRNLLDTDRSMTNKGGIFVTKALIQDWPDYKLRQIGGTQLAYYFKLFRSLDKINTPAFETEKSSFLKNNKEFIDYLLHYKINMGSGQTSRIMTNPDVIAEASKELNEYARARGIEFVAMHNFTNVGNYPKDKDDPLLTRCVDYRVHKYYFCWSLLEVHKKRAQKMAENLKKHGYNWLYMHDVDGGGWENPGMWKDRCDQCKKMYGSDKAKADATIFGIYYDAGKKLIKDFKMVAVVYPYAGRYINADFIEKEISSRKGASPSNKIVATKTAKYLQDYLSRLGKLLNPNIKICQREGTKQDFKLLEKSWGKSRDFFLYLEAKNNKAWHPAFSTGARWLTTYYRPGRNDVYFASGSPYGNEYPTSLLSAQFGWTVRSPGAELYQNRDIALYDYRHHYQPEKIADEYISKICRNFWGPEIGPLMIPVFNSNISYMFIQKPEYIAQRMKLLNTRDLMKKESDKTAKAMESMEKARRVYDQIVATNRDPIPDPVAHKAFGDFYRFSLAAKTASAFRWRLLEAKHAIIKGETEKVDKLLDEASELIKRDQKYWNKQLAWMDKVPHSLPQSPKWNYIFGRFYNYDFDALKKEIKQFKKEKKSFQMTQRMPKWYKPAMKVRKLYAVPAKSSVVIDGKLNEVAWQQAPLNFHFINLKSQNLPKYETAIQLTYDDKYLYLASQAYKQNIKKTKGNTNRNRDEIDWKHAIELFLDVNEDKKTYFHFAWDIDGNIYDSKTVNDQDGAIRKVTKNYSPQVRSKVKILNDRWVLEARIPLKSIGLNSIPPIIRGNVCRSDTDESGVGFLASTALVSGSTFHAPDQFVRIQFLRKIPSPKTPHVNFKIQEKQSRQVTIESGVGFETAFDIELDTSEPLTNATLTAMVSNGNSQYEPLNVFKNKNIALIWKASETLGYLAKRPVKGLEFKFTLKADQGIWFYRHIIGIVKKKDYVAKFTEGKSGQALQSSAWFSPVVNGKKLFSNLNGTVEMWVKIDGQLVSPLQFGPMPTFTFLHSGPARFDLPFANNLSSLHFYRYGKYLFSKISNSNYQNFMSSTPMLPTFSKKGWHHIAFQWATEHGNQVLLETFLDGKKLSNKNIMKQLHKKPWKIQWEEFPVQIGSMTNGYSQANMLIDEVRISSEPRYKEDFTPQAEAVLDRKTTILFHFDGNLNGVTPEDQIISATAGPAR